VQTQPVNATLADLVNKKRQKRRTNKADSPTSLQQKAQFLQHHGPPKQQPRVQRRPTAKEKTKALSFFIPLFPELILSLFKINHAKCPNHQEATASLQARTTADEAAVPALQPDAVSGQLHATCEFNRAVPHAPALHQRPGSQ